MMLTKHENETFQGQTVYISGQAFLNCTFVACTLVLRETVYHLENCSFDRCNWHVDLVLMWGSADSVRELRELIGLLEQARQASEQQEKAGAEPPGMFGLTDVRGGTSGGPRPGRAPFA